MTRVLDSLARETDNAALRDISYLLMVCPWCPRT